MRRFALSFVLLLAGPAAAQSAAELVAASRAEMRTNPEASRRHAELALVALAAQPDVDLAIRAHIQLCEYQVERNSPAAQQAIDQARALLPQTRQAGLRAAVLACEGEIHETASANALAMALYHQAVEVAAAAKDPEVLADSLYRRGYLRGLTGEFATGLADLQRAIAIYDQLSLRHQAQIATSGVAILYNRMGDWAQARQYFEASLKAEIEAGLLREQIVTRNNLGRVFENLQDWGAAQRSFEAVFALSRELDYPRGEAYALRGLAAVRNARGDPVAALGLIDRAEALLGPLPDTRLRALLLLQRGIALRAQGRSADSATALKQALQIFLKADSPAEVATAHRELALSFTAQGDWHNAYDHQVQLQAVAENLMKRQLDQRLATLRIEFDSAAKDKENALLQREKDASERALAQEKRATRLQAVVLGLVVLLAAVLATLAWRQRRTSREMQSLAMTDELTGLPNRRAVLARLTTMLAAPGGCALLIIDVDHFKLINDRVGHLAGDEILRAVAGVLREATREPVTLGRIGGEEFILAAAAIDAAGAAALAERVTAAARALDCSAWLPGGRVTVSIGLTLALPDDSVSDLLRRADAAMYAAKAAGRDRIELRLARPPLHAVAD
ncbi:MAG: GGDEF domain-containing protein [Burkholderiaceae bacterium]